MTERCARSLVVNVLDSLEQVTSFRNVCRVQNFHIAFARFTNAAIDSLVHTVCLELAVQRLDVCDGWQCAAGVAGG